jgi:hypothetical protein
MKPATCSSESARTARRLHVAGALSTFAYAALAIASHLQPERLVWVLLFCMGMVWFIALAAAGAVGNLSAVRPIRWILAYGLLFRAIGFFGQPIFEDDFYRFLWDGRMFAVNGTPYGVAPSESFGDPALDERFESILNQVNHPQIPTLYGPVFQFVFLASYWMAPGALWALKLILIGAELGAFAVLRRWLTPAATLLWLWCPLVIQETAFSAHPDALGLVAMTGALASARVGRASFAGVLMGVAVGARPFAVLLLPFLLSSGWRRTLAGFIGAIALLHAPFLVGNAGPWGGLGTFAMTWEFNSAAFAVLQVAFGAGPAKLIGAMIFGASYLMILRRWWPTDAEYKMPPGDLCFGLLFLVSPVINPWYLQWLVPFVAVRPRAWTITFLMMVTLSYATFQNLDPLSDLGFHHPNWVRPVEFGAIALAGLTPWIWRRWRLRRGS